MSSDLLKELRKSSQYKAYQKVYENALSKVDLDRDRREALDLHSTLEVRSLYGKKRYSPKAIMDAVGQVQANRSRLVELRARASVHLSYVEEAATAFRRYAYTKYADEFKEYRTKDQREALLQRATSLSSDFLGEGNSFLDLMDHLIKDLDQASHALRHMIDILKLLSGAKGQNIV